ncbi:DUF4019 domain-containing protein [Pseudomonas sp. NPDC089569]|uniref:DUF4019 domain-containing protein n=1 Tax=Pseudomonas sp. NPDC089569 TaxID=3390722 RepID=UPI003D05196C
MRDSGEAHRYLDGKFDVNILLACVLGVAFLSVMIVMAVLYPNPNDFQLKVFTTTLALAAGGFGAIIPGSLVIEHKNFLRAGGAIGLVILVLYFQPEIKEKVIKFIEPAQSAEPIALEYLQTVDNSQTDNIWRLMDPESKGYTFDSLESLTQIFNTFRRPLGTVVSRELTGMNSVQSPQGYPLGLYRALVYRTHFSNDGTCRMEQVVVRATQDLTWKVFSYTISPSLIPCA